MTDRLPGSGAATEAPDGCAPDDPSTTALLDLIGRSRGTWIGRGTDMAIDGSTIDGSTEPGEGRQRALRLDLDDVRAFDHGQSRSAIWPLYHDLAGPAQYHPHWRRAYRSVNASFARAAAEEAARGATVLIPDYKLQLVPGILRRLRPDVRIGFHLRTPFPAPDLFRRMPLHRDVLTSLLRADLVGFQTASSAENFLRLGLDLNAAPPDVGVYPVGADSRAIARLAVRRDILDRAAALRRSLGDPAIVILSVNSPDQAQGVERRLLSLEESFRTGQLKPQRVVVIQVLLGTAPTLDSSVSDGVARAVARLNGQHASVGRPCVHYTVATPDLADRVVLYLAADLMLATPLREGATVPALEFVAAARSDAALVLSEFSGTAVVLPDAYVVNPYDDDAVRMGVSRALAATRDERAGRMRHMNGYTDAYDNHCWAERFVSAVRSSRPHQPAALDPVGSPSTRTLRSRRRFSVHSGDS